MTRRDETEDTTSVDMAALLADSSSSAAVVSGRYQLGEVLGEGGMAVVHRAQDIVLQRPVAVKLLREHVAGTAERGRFTSEVRTLGALSHPGLVTVLDAGVSKRQPYLVMELVPGGTLADVPAPVPLHRAADIGSQLAAALAYAHEHGVIHRDVKPANVLLGPDGRVKLADFGIARIVGDTVHHTQTGTLIGTVSYLSPEQVEGAELTPALDVYSLGLMLLELITGRRPFPGPSVESALSRLTRSPEMPLDLPAAWWVLLSAMTARNPADRPSALEVSERLAALRGVTGAPVLADAQAAPAPVPTPVPAPAPTPAPTPVVTLPRTRVPSRARGVLVAVAAVVLLIATAAAAGGKGVRGNDGEAAAPSADVARPAPTGTEVAGQQAAGAVAAVQAKKSAAADRARRQGHTQAPGAGAKATPASKHSEGHKAQAKGDTDKGHKGKSKNKDKKGKNKAGKKGGKHR